MTPTPTSGAADLPEALRSIQRFEVVDCIDDKHVPAVIPKPHGPWVRYEDHAAELHRLHAYCQELESQVILDCMTHVQKPAEIEHVAGDVSKNGAGLNMSTQHARITELESQLAQRFDVADMATAAAQGFRDGVASVSTGSASMASYAARLLAAAALVTQAKADEALRFAEGLTAALGPADGESNGN